MGGLTTLFGLPLFGVATMSILLDVHPRRVPRRRWICAMAFAAILVILNIWVCVTLGRRTYRTYYLFWVQLPMLILFGILSAYRGAKLLFTLLTAIVLASVPTTAILVCGMYYPDERWLRSVAFLVTAVALVVGLHVAPNADFRYMLEHGEDRYFRKFCLIPLLHYIYTFGLSKYDFVQEVGQEGFWLRRIPTLVVFLSYLLLLSVFRDTRERLSLQRQQDSLQLQLAASRQQREQLAVMEQQTAAHRHDMRHHLALIGGYLSDGSTEKAMAYLTEVQRDLDSITPKRFCQHETMNLIFSAFEAKAAAVEVALQIQAQVPAHLPMGDTELCALLSNLLENAIRAASAVPDGRARTVTVTAKQSDNNRLLLRIENPYAGQVQMKDGLPRTNQEGHGYGVPNVESILEKHGGTSFYEAKDGCFTVRILL